VVRVACADLADAVAAQPRDVGDLTLQGGGDIRLSLFLIKLPPPPPPRLGSGCGGRWHTAKKAAPKKQKAAKKKAAPKKK
jgi:hypothetical protein